MNRKRDNLKATDEQFGTSANSIPVNRRKAPLSVSNAFNSTSTNTIPIRSKKASMLANEIPTRSKNTQMFVNSSPRETNSTTFGRRESQFSSALNGTGANTIPVISKKAPMLPSKISTESKNNRTFVSGGISQFPETDSAKFEIKKASMLSNEISAESKNNRTFVSGDISRCPEADSATFDSKKTHESFNNVLNGTKANSIQVNSEKSLFSKNLDRTGANTIPISHKKLSLSENAFQIKRNPMPPPASNASAANAIPVSSKKSSLSSNAFQARNKKILMPDKTSTAANAIPVSSQRSLLSVINSLKGTSESVASTNNSKPVKVNHVVGNFGNVKPVLSTDSKRSARKSRNSSNEQTPFVVSELVGKFVDDQKQNTIIVEDFEWRRLYEPNLKHGKRIAFNLQHNIETFEHNPFYYGMIDPILKYIMKIAKKGASLSDVVQGCELVTSRGNLVKIATFNACDYFYNAKLWCQLVFCKFNGVIFAYERFTEEKILYEMNLTQKQKCIVYWGYKFEQYVTTEFPNDKPNLNKPVSTLCPQYGVFKTQITGSNNRKLSSFINGEVDAIDKKGDFVELKTANGLNPMCEKNNWNNVNKSKWWLQCALGDVKRIFVGMRDNRGIVSQIKKLDVPIKRNNRKEEKREWKQKDCVDFLLNFFDEVRKLLDSKVEGALLKVDFFAEPQKEIKKTWVADSERNKYEFLPPEFIKQFSPANES